MVLNLKKLKIPAAAGAFLIVVAIVFAVVIQNGNKSSFFMGGAIHSAVQVSEEDQSVINQSDEKIDFARFNRPSNQAALYNPFTLDSFSQGGNDNFKITHNFSSPQDAAKAFFGILQEASNMEGYSGGCGTIGNAMEPYQYAYQLLSPETQKNMTLAAFTDSFKGIGHITLLKVYPTYTPSGTPKNIHYYMFEIEAITGPSEKDRVTYGRDGSYFAYYYGIITIEGDTESGFYVKSIEYIPEDFLCAPYHGWRYDGQLVTEFVYKDWHHIIDEITGTEKKGNIVYVYATGKGGKYRFDFVRLTNGYDILLHENICKDGVWQETNLLKPSDQTFRLAPVAPMA